MRMIFLTAAAALALASCTGGNQTVPAANDAAENVTLPTDSSADGNAIGNEAVPSDFLARVTSMNDRERNVVLVRAIMDSENKCDGVVKSERQPDSEGKPVYRAWCRDGTRHIVIFQKDGIAKVLSPTAD